MPSELKFIFLGTGTSAGVPAIGCDCAVCTSADPRDNRLRTAAAVRFCDAAGHERVVLLDAGPDLRAQALRFGIRRCDAILFTHNHVDHTFGLDEVRRFNAVQREAIPIYADDRTMESLHRVYRHIFDADRNINQSFVATLLPIRIEPERPIDLFGLRFLPFTLHHGRLPVLGFRIEPAEGDAPEGSLFPLAYCTDVSGIPPAAWKHLRGLRTLVLDALRHRHHPTHFTLEQAVGAALEAGASQTYFVHMAHDLAHAETDAALPESMRLAYDGLTLGE